MEVLSLCLPSIKMSLQNHHISAFFFMAQITQILSFSEMGLLERSKIRVLERQLLKKIICYESLGFVSALRQKVFSGAPVKCIFFIP